MAAANVRRWGMGSPEPKLDDVGTIARCERMGSPERWGGLLFRRKPAFPRACDRPEHGPIVRPPLPCPRCHYHATAPAARSFEASSPR